MITKAKKKKISNNSLLWCHNDDNRPLWPRRKHSATLKLHTVTDIKFYTKNIIKWKRGASILPALPIWLPDALQECCSRSCSRILPHSRIPHLVLTNWLPGWLNLLKLAQNANMTKFDNMVGFDGVQSTSAPAWGWWVVQLNLNIMNSDVMNYRI